MAALRLSPTSVCPCAIGYILAIHLGDLSRYPFDKLKGNCNALPFHCKLFDCLRNMLSISLSRLGWAFALTESHLKTCCSFSVKSYYFALRATVRRNRRGQLPF